MTGPNLIKILSQLRILPCLATSSEQCMKDERELCNLLGLHVPRYSFILEYVYVRIVMYCCGKQLTIHSQKKGMMRTLCIR